MFGLNLVVMLLQHASQQSDILIELEIYVLARKLNME